MLHSLKSLRRAKPAASSRTAKNCARFRPAVEPLEARLALTLPFGAMPHDTGEYLLGEIYVNLVLMESNGGLDASTENWTPALIQEVKDKVSGALAWWKDTLVANGYGANPLNFTLGTTYADAPISTPYEPIANVSDFFELWTEDFFNQVGFNSQPTFSGNIRDFNNAQREAQGADWSFTLFVANSTNDVDDRFEIGGSFTGAFAYAGGEFVVAPSGRPLSTFAHEIGHMFWAFDEYAGSKSYFEHRGYYNTQNLNATDQHPNPASRSPSIMSNGSELTTAFNNHTSPASTLQMIGWRDSDGDGLFDVIDVPHMLVGAGDYNPATGMYRFTGESSVVALPNLNPSGLQNDITINRISRAEYRIDGGAWQTAATYNTAQAVLDFTIGPLSPGSHAVEIRTIDDRTGVTSASFFGSTDRDSSTLRPGINGYVWHDANANGLREPGELGLAGWSVELVDDNEVPLSLEKRVEPDDYPQDTVLNSVNAAVTLTALGDGVTTSQVIARDRSPSSTGTKTFTHVISSGISASWTQSSRQLHIDFTAPVSTLSLDAVGNGTDPLDYGRLEAYDANGNLVGRYTTAGLANGVSETMTIQVASPLIKFAIAKAHNGTALHLDNLRFGPQAATVTNIAGAFALPSLSPGTYNVRAVPVSGYTILTPSSAVRTITLGEGEAEADVDFGAATSASGSGWHNDTLAEDIDGNGAVNNTDLFLIVSELRTAGPRVLTGSPGSPLRYWDVHADGVLNNTDLFVVLSKLRNMAGGEGEGATGGGNSSGGSGEGEWRAWAPLLGELLPDVFTEFSDPARLSDDHHHSHDENDSGPQPSAIANTAEVASAALGDAALGSLALSRSAVDAYWARVSEAADTELAPRLSPWHPAGENRLSEILLGGRAFLAGVVKASSPAGSNRSDGANRSDGDARIADDELADIPADALARLWALAREDDEFLTPVGRRFLSRRQ